MRLEEKMEAAAAALRKPAGNSDQFSTPERILENKHDFVLACHKTWKYWHKEATRQILIFEGFSRREKQPRPNGRRALRSYAARALFALSRS
jgi:hypothetical protein